MTYVEVYGAAFPSDCLWAGTRRLSWDPKSVRIPPANDGTGSNPTTTGGGCDAGPQEVPAGLVDPGRRHSRVIRAHRHGRGEVKAGRQARAGSRGRQEIVLRQPTDTIGSGQARETGGGARQESVGRNRKPRALAWSRGLR